MELTVLGRRLLLALCLGCACLDPTEITISLTTDVPCNQLGGVSVRVGADPRKVEPSAYQMTCQSEGALGTLVVLPNASLGSSIVQVTAGVGKTPDQCDLDGDKGGCIVARRSLGFIEHKSLSLPIALQLSCVDVPCDQQSTCVNGACQPVQHLDLDAGGADAGPGVHFVRATSQTGTLSSTATRSVIVTMVPPPPVGAAVIGAVVASPTVTLSAPDASWVANLGPAATMSATVFEHVVRSPNEGSYTFGVSTNVVPAPYLVAIAVYDHTSTPAPWGGSVQVTGAATTFQSQPVNSVAAGGVVVGVFANLDLTAKWTTGSGVARLNIPGALIEEVDYPTGTLTGAGVAASCSRSNPSLMAVITLLP